MGKTKIQWSHYTFNPWRGCTKVSPGCANCYAAASSGMNPKVLGIWGKNGSRPGAAAKYWRDPLTWNAKAAAAGERHRVFCGSLMDIFEGPETMPASFWPSVQAARARVFDLIKQTPSLDWLLLTKRPENILGMLPADWGDGYPNVALMTSVENQEQAELRIPLLLAAPAAARGLSLEPLLARVTMRSEWLYPNFAADDPRYYRPGGRGVDWMIVGGESGARTRRPMDPQWARSLRDQATSAGVAFHFKQWGRWYPLASADEADNYPGTAMIEGENVRWVDLGKEAAGRVLDGREWDELPEFAVFA